MKACPSFNAWADDHLRLGFFAGSMLKDSKKVLQRKRYQFNLPNKTH